MDCKLQIQRLQEGQWRWASFDLATSSLMNSGTFEPGDTPSDCPGSSSVIAFLPQHEILMTQADLPARAPKQQLAAIDYAIEDQLAEDVEDCFCAIGRQLEDGSVPVAVINRELMQGYAELFNQSGLKVKAIYPEFYLCPWRDDEVSAVICDSSHGFVLRYARHKGIYCSEEILTSVLGLLKSQQGKDIVTEYYGERQIGESESGITVHHRSKRDWLAQFFEDEEAINLKQKEFHSGYSWKEPVKKWKWAIAATILLLISTATLNISKTLELQNELDRILSAQAEVIEPYLGPVDEGQTPKQKLIAALSEALPGSGEGFLDVLHEFSQLKSKYQSIQVDKIQFQNSSLVVNLESKNLRDMEAFRTRVGESRFAARIENVSISPQQTTARLIMEVGNS